MDHLSHPLWPSIAELSAEQPVLLVVIRHFG